MQMIEVEKLSKSFGRQEVLRGVDLTVEAGEIVGLLGPNGAGKTTLVNILSTLVLPDSGTARVAGFDVVTESDEVRRRISITGQSSAVDELLTADENLRMIGRLSGLSASSSRQRSAELLARFDLVDAARRRVASYSGGMRRRLDLALSLVVAKPVVFLDEPTTGLDTRSRRELWAAIRTLADDGAAVLLTTQYLEEADQLADRVALLDGGRVVASGTADDLKARIGDELSLPAPTLDDVFLALTGRN
ncbi:ATP-binding cassette domain-containing protein [Naasia lichenicola]|uniref:ATP-binding cassette domain-containing protein n=2 Tax=Naasia lichenicola TaxID=2565933 RepID=A0A4S4FQK8_9MICO|nr:ATP-binding cassette domain-containing protein [Naasia lichenicola]THG32883.1 ATP-binding cassette domain-containing protein [Naasia lichenicola]